MTLPRPRVATTRLLLLSLLACAAQAAPELIRIQEQNLPSGNQVRYSARIEPDSPFVDTLTHHRLITAGKTGMDALLGKLEALASERGATWIRLNPNEDPPCLFAVRSAGSPPTLGSVWMGDSEPWVHIIQVTLDPSLLSQPQSLEAHLYAWRYTLQQLWTESGKTTD